MEAFITGGAGFIGANLSAHLLAQGHRVTIYDNLARPGARLNLQWLEREFGGAFRLVPGDVRDYEALREVISPKTEALYHLAAQVAVTTSVVDPRADFEINALGTLNVLEALREKAPEALLFYTSTNKVYGRMEDLAIGEREGRYQYLDLPMGISEARPLDFHSPYGCSKGSADQYARDYARIYGLRTVVFRMSCIYGPHQFGTEDQGWVAHFIISALLGRPLTIYGDGQQVRDVLYIDDLLRGFDLAREHTEETSGKVYNIGGGPANVLSLLELIGLLEKALGRKIELSFSEWRPGDQRVYVSDIRRAKEDMGWEPQVPKEKGIQMLLEWASGNIELLSSAVAR